MRTRLRNPVAIGALTLGALVLVAATVIAIDQGSGQDDGRSVSAEKITGALPDGGGLEFLVDGPATVDKGELIIKTDAVEWFTDSPKRDAGLANVTQLASAWDEYGFAGLPPNAAVAGGGTKAVVKLTTAERTSDGIAFEFSTLDGKLRSGALGNVSAFIDATSYSCHADIYNRTKYTLDVDDSGNTEPSVGSAGWSGGPARSLPADGRDAPQSAHLVFSEDGALTSTGTEEIPSALAQGGGSNYNPFHDDPSGLGFIHYVVSGKGDDGPGVWVQIGCKRDDNGDVKFMDAHGVEANSDCAVSDDFAATCSVQRSDKQANHGKFFIDPK